MSAPLKMNAEQITALAEFLDKLTIATRETGCRLQPYGSGAIELPIARDVDQPTGALAFIWDAANDEYRIDDRNGD